MYNDHMLYIQACDSFGVACGLLVQSGCFDVDEMQEFIKHSNIVSELISGKILLSSSSSLTLVMALAKEANKESYNDIIIDNYRSRKRDSFALWLGKTELDIAIRTSMSISSLRELVSAEKLRQLYGIYHIFYRTDTIMEEHYFPQENVKHYD